MPLFITFKYFLLLLLISLFWIGFLTDFIVRVLYVKGGGYFISICWVIVFIDAVIILIECAAGVNSSITQPTFTRSKPAMKISEQCVKYV